MRVRTSIPALKRWAILSSALDTAGGEDRVWGVNARWSGWVGAGIIGVFAFTGCATAIHSEAELYFHKYPEERTRYSRFSPTDDRAVEDIAIAVETTRRHWASSLKERGEDPQRLEEMARLKERWYKEDMKLAATLREAAKKTGGQIYKYEIHKPPHGESGYAIIRNGEIVEKVHVETWKIHE